MWALLGQQIGKAERTLPGCGEHLCDHHVLQVSFYWGLRGKCGNNPPQSIDNMATCEIKAYNITQARNLVQKSKQCDEKRKASNSHLL